MRNPDTHTERFLIEQGYNQPLTSLLAYESYPLDPEIAGSRQAIVKNIADGQIEPDASTTIWHASSTEPLRDVTAEIAEEVAHLLRREYTDLVSSDLAEFLEEHLGCYAVERIVGAQVRGREFA